MRSSVPHDVLDLASIRGGQGARGPCLCPSRVLPFWASWVLGGPRRHRWITSKSWPERIPGKVWERAVSV
eukprot:2247243-Pyramimonas_sp.AAC.1